MTTTVKTLIESTLLAPAATTQYLAPASTRTIIDKFTATNTSAAAATLSVNLVAAAGAAAAANLVINARALGPGESYTCPEVVGHVLNAGDFISTSAGTGAVISIRSSGREVT